MYVLLVVCLSSLFIFSSCRPWKCIPPLSTSSAQVTPINEAVTTLPPAYISTSLQHLKSSPASGFTEFQMEIVFFLLQTSSFRGSSPCLKRNLSEPGSELSLFYFFSLVPNSYPCKVLPVLPVWHNLIHCFLCLLSNATERVMPKFSLKQHICYFSEFLRIRWLS